MFEPKGPIKIDDANLTGCQRYIARLLQDRRAADLANCCDFMSLFDSEKRRQIAALVVHDRLFWLTLGDLSTIYKHEPEWPENQAPRHTRKVYSHFIRALESRFKHEDPPESQALARAFVERIARKPTAMVFRFNADGSLSRKRNLKLAEHMTVFAASVSSSASERGTSRWTAICGMYVAFDRDNLPKYAIFPYWTRLGPLIQKALQTSMETLAMRILFNRKAQNRMFPWELLFFGTDWDKLPHINNAWRKAEARMFLDDKLNEELEEIVLGTLL